MKKVTLFVLMALLYLGTNNSFGQAVNVDVNLNIKHSVDGVSDFGRERRMTIHSSLTEGDWTGHEDMLDYLVNELDVYFGRETGSAGWKNQGVEEDPNNPGWANEAQMITHSTGLKQWYDSDDFADRHQYEEKSKGMIMGINDHCPAYPTLSWDDHFGKGAGGWFVEDTDAAADWIAKYLEHYYASEEGASGEPLPKYWEAYNEPDMNMMNAQFGMIISSIEKNWEYHKLVAEQVRARLGDKAPLIGGMCWGQLDLYKRDGIPTRQTLDYWTQWLETDNPMIPKYENMLSGVGSGVTNPGVGHSVWPKAWDNRADAWWQWDYMYQGFIDYCGADMDFYAVHMYDWPQASVDLDKANTRSGGHVEAMLDMFEWYDNEQFGAKKEIILSEFGTVNNTLIDGIPDGRRDWLYLKPFNQMMMQFLERPSHVTYSMPFAPVKATWGAHFNGATGTNVPVYRYQGATLMEPLGSWTGNGTTWEKNEPTGGWGWSGIIHFFELWKDVEGTRVDTKSDDVDVQVDSYVDGNKVFVILNNGIDENKAINLYTHGAGSNTVNDVEFRHIYRGDDDFTKYEVTKMTTAPSQVTLKPNSTIILVYTYANTVVIDEESQETKFMCAPLAGSSLNKRGTQLCHTGAQNSITATVNGVERPAIGEAIIRVGGFFYASTDGGDGVRVKTLTVNDNDVIVEADNFVAETRGYGVGNWAGGWFGVLEIECPVEYLNDGVNTIYFERFNNTEFTTVMIQAFDMTAEPGRTTGGSAISGLLFNESSEDLVEGQTLGLAPVFTPANTLDKGLTWSSSNSSVVSVDENGVVTALASSGNATITATSTANTSISSSITVNAVMATPVTGITINEGPSMDIAQHYNSELTVTMTPTPEVAPNVIWTTSDENIVSILSDGTIVGTGLGQTATITATVEGTTVSDDITVTVQLPDGETISSSRLPDFITPLSSYTFDVPVEIMGERTVLVELLHNSSVLASGTETVDAIGDETASVTVDMPSIPTVTTGYEIKLTLLDGTTELATKTVAIEMRAPIDVTDVTLPDGPMDMVHLSTKTIRATVLPSNASDQRVTWSSENDAIASVDENGKVTANAIGSTDITVTTVDQGIEASITVNVVEFSGVLVVEAEDFDTQGGPQAAIAISDVGINNVQTQDYVEFNVYIPETGEYTASFWLGSKMIAPEIEFLVDGVSVGSKTVVPSGAWDTYEEVALDNAFTMTEGERTLRVLASGDEQWQWNMDYFTLTFIGSTDVESVQISSETYLIGVGQTKTLEATVYPLIASNKNVSWSSDDEDVLTVVNGEITAHTTGTATVTVTTEEGGFTDECVVTVQTEPILTFVESITITPESVSLPISGTRQLSTSALPVDADDKTVSWSSSIPGVASVSTTGLVTGVANGTTTITAAANDGSGVTQSIQVTVSDVLTIEAEDLVSTGGTFDDGNNNDINVSGIGVNYVNAGDWAEYTLVVADAGEYEMTYYISCPTTDGNITVLVDGVQQSSNAIPDNGLGTVNGWETYIPITASSTATLTAGTHTFRIEASGSDWQWNLDKIEFIRTGDISDVNVTGISIAPGVTEVAVGSTINLSAAVAPDNATDQGISWSSENEDIATVANGVVQGLSAGTVDIIATSDDGGHTARVSITVTNDDDVDDGTDDVDDGTDDDGTVSFFETPSQAVTLYPNPATSSFVIDGLSSKSTIIVYDLRGKIYRMIESSNNKEQIDISSCPAGLYLVKIVSNGTRKKFRLMKN